jgi:hypothetical protein
MPAKLSPRRLLSEEDKREAFERIITQPHAAWCGKEQVRAVRKRRKGAKAKTLALLLLSLLLSAAWPASAASSTIITATITVTNAPTMNGMTLTVNGDVRTWTNSIWSPASQIMTNLTIAGSGTNLFNAIADSPFLNLSIGQLANTNGVSLQTVAPNGPLSASLTGNWGFIVLSTNTLTTAQIVRVPISVESSANQISIASMLVQALELSTYALSATATALSNYASLTQAQTITGQKTLISPIETNDVHLNSFLASPILTNGFNYGTAFTSPGAYGQSEQFGAGALATSNGASAFGSTSWAAGKYATALGQSAVAAGDYSSAVGDSALASAYRSIGIGVSSRAQGNNSVALGNQSTAFGNYSVAIGDSSTAANALNATALGQGSTAGYQNSTALGQGVSTTTSNQVMLGQSSQVVAVPGSFQVGGSVNNLTVSGTNNYPAGSDLAFGRYALSTLANGNNAGVVIGTNVFADISGPTGVFTVNGIAGGRDGKFVILSNRTGQNMTIANDSGVEPLSANRIYNASGADKTVNGNSSALLIYNGSLAHWLVLTFTQ